LLSSSINPPSSNSLSSTSTTTSAVSQGLVVQDGEQRLWATPFPDIDRFVSDSPCRILCGLVVESTLAKITLAVRWHLETQGHRPQVRNFTEKINRRFRVAILQFTVGRAHTAQRANLALRALGPSLSFPGANL
jgi:hypothetical protein